MSADNDPIDTIINTDRAMIEAIAALHDAVAAAREAGCHWSEIGGCLGVSAQAAQQRFGTRARPLSRAFHERYVLQNEQLPF